jgi:hypothetical protein
VELWLRARRKACDPPQESFVPAILNRCGWVSSNIWGLPRRQHGFFAAELREGTVIRLLSPFERIVPILAVRPCQPPAARQSTSLHRTPGEDFCALLPVQSAALSSGHPSKDQASRAETMTEAVNPSRRVVGQRLGIYAASRQVFIVSGLAGRIRGNARNSEVETSRRLPFVGPYLDLTPPTAMDRSGTVHCIKSAI